MRNQPPPFARPQQQLPRTAKAAEPLKMVRHKLVGGRCAGLAASIDARDMATLRSGGMVRFHIHPSGDIFSRRAFEDRVDRGKLDPAGTTWAQYRMVRFTVPRELQPKFAWWVDRHSGPETLLVHSIVPAGWSSDQAKAVAVMTLQHSFTEALPVARPASTSTLTARSTY